MICERCGTVFCWDGADQILLGGPRIRFCSRQCAKRSRPSYERRRQRENCTDRGKQDYEDAAAASVAASLVWRGTGLQLYPYECACGAWHLSKLPQERKEMAFALKRALFRGAL